MTNTAGAGQPPKARRYGSSFVSLTVGAVLIVGLAVLLLWNTVLVRVPPGHVGVLYRLLGAGTETTATYAEGLVTKLPWNTMYLVDTRLQPLKFTMLAVSAEGMQVGIEATTLYHVKSAEAGRLVAEVGLDYADRVIRPVSMAAMRRIISRYNSHDLYTIDADKLQAELLEYMRSTPEARLFHYSDVAIATMKLPDKLVAAIERKLSEQQRAASYEYILDSQRKEAERLRIEAIGLRNFYAVIQNSLTDKLLTWRGIEATVELSKSPNTKIVIVGSNKDQLPLILGGDITRPLAEAAPPVPPVAGDAAPLPDLSKMPPIFNRSTPPAKSP
jgi:prohibitin 2